MCIQLESTNFWWRVLGERKFRVEPSSSLRLTAQAFQSLVLSVHTQIVKLYTFYWVHALFSDSTEAARLNEQIQEMMAQFTPARQKTRLSQESPHLSKPAKLHHISFPDFAPNFSASRALPLSQANMQTGDSYQTILMQHSLATRSAESAIYIYMFNKYWPVNELCPVT
jgi:hypothetical protein